MRHGTFALVMIRAAENASTDTKEGRDFYAVPFNAQHGVILAFFALAALIACGRVTGSQKSLLI